MIRFLLIIMFSCVAVEEKDKSNNYVEGRCILWSCCDKLKYEDFRGEPSGSKSNFTAVSHLKISYEYTFNKEGFTVLIKTEFCQDKSWMTVKDSNLLNHEQRHFDISEFFSRKLSNLISLDTFSIETIDQKLRDYHRKIVIEEKETHALYDTETNFSLNSSKQALWNSRVDSLLELYSHENNVGVKKIIRYWW